MELHKLSQMHQNLQQNLFSQTLENKRLQQDLMTTQERPSDQKLKAEINTLNELLIEARNDKVFLVKRIDELQHVNQQQTKKIQEIQVQTQIDQFKEQTRAEMNGKLNDEGQHWMTHSERLVEQSSKFLMAMKKLQKAVNPKKGAAPDGSKADVADPKQQFELHKKLLEQMIRETKKQLQNQNNIPTNQSEPSEAIKSEFQRETQELQTVLKNKIVELQNQQFIIDEQNLKLAANEEVLVEEKVNFNSIKLENAELQDKIRDLQDQLVRLGQSGDQQIESLENALNEKEVMLRELNQELLTISAQINVEKKEQESQTAPYIAPGPTPVIMKEVYSQNERQNSNLNRITELESFNKQLEHHAKTQEVALKNLREQNRALTAQLDVFKKKVSQNDDQDGRIDLMKVELESALQKFESSQARHKHEISEVQKKHKEIVNKYECQIEEINESFSEISQTLEQKLKQINDKETTIKTQKEHILKQGTKIKLDKTQIENLKKQNVDEMNKFKNEFSESNLQYQSKIEDIEKKLKDQSNFHLKEKTNGLKLQKIIDDQSLKFQEITQENEKLTKDLEEIKKKLKEAHLNQENLKKGSNEKKEECDKIKKFVSELEEKLKQNFEKMTKNEKEFKLKIKEKDQTNQQNLEKLKKMSLAQIDDLSLAKAKLQEEYNALKESKQEKLLQSSNLLQNQNDQIKSSDADKIKIKHEAEKEDLQQQIKSLNDDLNEAEQIREKHQLTLEKNRDLISLLKGQLEKAIDVQNNNKTNQNMEKKFEIQKQKTDLLQQENQKLKKESEKTSNQNNLLKEQVQALKLQFQEKMQTLSNKIDSVQNENNEKEDLINEANRVIEEFTEDKHDTKAKFKHLVQAYVLNRSKSIDQSSYKGNDSSLSLTNCFTQLQNALEGVPNDGASTVRIKNRSSKVVQENGDQASIDDKEAIGLDQEIKTMNQKQNNIQKTLEISNEMIIQNDIEVQRQLSQLCLAHRKINNYKQKLFKKSQHVKSMKDDIEKIIHEKKQLLMKIAELEKKFMCSKSEYTVQVNQMKTDLQSARQQLESVQIDKELSDAQLILKEKEAQRSNEDADKAIKKITELSENLEKIRAELITEKIKNEPKPEALMLNIGEKPKKSETSEEDDRDYSKLELEHVELLGRLQKTESELNKVRQQQKETQKKEEVTETLKVSEETKQDLDQLKVRINEIHRKLNLSRGEIVQTIKSDYDSQIVNLKQIISSYIMESSGQKEKEKTNLENEFVNNSVKEIMKLNIRDTTYLVLQVDDQIQLINMGHLSEKVLEHIRSYQPEYKNELEIPYKLDDNGARLDQCESPNPQIKMFCDEIKELRSEQKEIASDYYEMRMKLEQNIDVEDEQDFQALKDDVQFFTAENCELRMKIKSLVMHSLQQKIRIQELNILIEKEEEKMQNKNGFDLSGIIKQYPNGLDQDGDAATPLNRKSINEVQAQIDMIDSNRSIINSLSQSNIFMNSINNTTDITQDLDLSNISSIDRKLQNANHQMKFVIKKLQDTKTEAMQLTQDLKSNQVKPHKIEDIQEGFEEQKDKKLDSSSSSNGSFRTTLQHVKGTLIQFLRKTPIIDLTNEMLLKIIYSMMEFTQQEIDDLHDYRQSLPPYKVDEAQRRKNKKDSNSGNHLNQKSNNSSGRIDDRHSAGGNSGNKGSMEMNLPSKNQRQAVSTPKGTSGGTRILDAMINSRNRMTPTRTDSQQSNEGKVKDKMGQALSAFFGKSISRDNQIEESKSSNYGGGNIKRDVRSVRLNTGARSSVQGSQSGRSGRSQTSSLGSGHQKAPVPIQRFRRSIEDGLEDSKLHNQL